MNRLVELAEDNFEFNFDLIFKSCLKDQDAAVRSKAIEGLWENEETSLINPLINLLEDDSSETVRAAAATALGKFAMLAECKKVRPIHAAKVGQTLLAVIDDTSQAVEVRRRALEAAAPLSLLPVKQAVMRAYRSQNLKFKVSAIYTMGKTCHRSWLPILIKELANDDTEIRYEAAGACGELEEAEAVPHLVRLTHDPDIDVAVAALQALGKIGGSEAKESLEKHLDDTNEAIYQAAEQALEKLKAKEDPLSFQIIQD